MDIVRAATCVSFELTRYASSYYTAREQCDGTGQGSSLRSGAVGARYALLLQAVFF